MQKEKILIVDDEVGLLELLKITLKKEHFSEITCVTTATEALANIHSINYDLIVLDVGLPDFSGFDLCQEIRRYTLSPIIFLTARDSTLDKLSGLSIGGDDYITKPFEPLEVVARVKAILRRQQYAKEMAEIQNTSVKIYDYGRFILNENNAVLTIDSIQIDCTAKEYDLLLYFCKNPNKVFTASQLYETVWNDLSVGDEKTVSMLISRLRKKLRDEKSPLMIQNLRGIGYKFIPPKKEVIL